MKSDLFTIIKKELARFFGDKRMVATAILPGILIYVMYSFMGSSMSEMYVPEEGYVFNVSVVDMPETISYLKDAEIFEITEISEDEIESVKEEIKAETKDLLVVFPESFDEFYINGPITAGMSIVPPNVEIYYNSANVDSAHAYDTMVGFLDMAEEMRANVFTICADEKEYDMATEEDVSAMLVSMIMPMLVLMMLFTGCLSAASESIAGEKERGTIATLLVTPVNRRDLALGKMISLSFIGLVSGMSSFLGIMLSLPNLMSGSGLENMSFGYTVSDYVVLMLVILSTTLIIVGAISVLSTFAKSVKEATSMATPLMIAVTLVGVSNMMSNGMPTEWYWYLIPIYNTVQCMNGVFSMDYQMIPVVITFVSNMVYAGVLVVVLTKMFNSERIMYT